jgi:hypothetical protein
VLDALLMEMYESAPPLPHVRDAARDCLIERIAAEVEPSKKSRRPGSARWARLSRVPAGRLTALGGVTIALVVVMLLGRGGDGERVSSAAAAALDHAAVSALHQRSLPPVRDGQFFYQEFLDQGLNTVHDRDGRLFHYLVVVRRRVWIGTVDHSRDREAVVRVVFPTAQDRAIWVSGGRPKLPQPGVSSIRYNAAFDLKLYRALSTDPILLRRQLLSLSVGRGNSTNQEMFAQIAQAINSLPVSQRQLSALLQVTTEIPGVIFRSHAKDALGRMGFAVSYDDSTAQQRDELIIDPRTGRLLQSASYALAQNDLGLARGAALSIVTYTGIGVSDTDHGPPKVLIPIR